MNSEQNRNARRDKKIERKKRGMRVDSSARKLAEILKNKGFKGSLKNLEEFINKAPTVEEITKTQKVGIDAFPPIKQAKNAQELRNHIERFI